MYPPFGERQQKGVDALWLDPVDMAQGALEIAGPCVLQPENEAGETRATADLDEAAAERDRLLDPAGSDQQRYDAAHERGVLGILVQHAPQVLRRLRIVAAAVRVVADEIAAER